MTVKLQLGPCGAQHGLHLLLLWVVIAYPQGLVLCAGSSSRKEMYPQRQGGFGVSAGLRRGSVSSVSEIVHTWTKRNGTFGKKSKRGLAVGLEQLQVALVPAKVYSWQGDSAFYLTHVVVLCGFF